MPCIKLYLKLDYLKHAPEFCGFFFLGTHLFHLFGAFATNNAGYPKGSIQYSWHLTDIAAIELNSG